jgi:molybdate transport system substrate-binding protein
VRVLFLEAADDFGSGLHAANADDSPRALTQDPTSGGASGIYMTGLMERLGIAAEVKPKTKLAAPGGFLYGLVAKGDAETAFNQISAVLAQPVLGRECDDKVGRNGSNDHRCDHRQNL